MSPRLWPAFEDTTIPAEWRFVMAFLDRMLADAQYARHGDATRVFHRKQAREWWRQPDAVWLELLDLTFPAGDVVYAHYLQRVGLEKE